jgi:hypothetical protein
MGRRDEHSTDDRREAARLAAALKRARRGGSTPNQQVERAVAEPNERRET